MLPSPPTIDKLLVEVEIKQLNYGTPSVNVRRQTLELNERYTLRFYLGKYTIVDDNHTDWVSCVRFSPNQKDPLIVSAGWDKLVKVSIR